MTPSINHIIIFLVTIFGISFADYWSDRESLLAIEASQLLGSSWELSEDEQKVNDILMELKLKEYDEGIADPGKFLPSTHFFKSKSAIEESEVFKFIQKIPKGGSLNSHTNAMLSTDALLNLTYMDGLYGCDNDGTFQLYFFFASVSDDCDWKLLEDWRREDPQFDDFLKNKLTLVVDDPVVTYSTSNAVWEKLDSIFTLIEPLFEYRTFLHDYLYQLLQEFHDDNVMYLEIRNGFKETFDSEGKIYDASETVQLYIDTQMEFRQENIDFIGFRVIYTDPRQLSDETIQEHIAQFLKLQETSQDLIAGFDLVGREDAGRPLSDFAEQFQEISNQTKFYFNAGETDWYGTSPDLNLIDAILLNTSRIGHGFAITKHPEILKIVKERDIAIELNPLSNQVLKLVDDLRNHIGVNLIARGYPVVIGCDNPSFWGAKGLSYDWYMAFMGMAPRNGDLRILKQLAYNSIFYSSLSEQDGPPWGLVLFEDRWITFIKDFLQSYQ